MNTAQTGLSPRPSLLAWGIALLSLSATLAASWVILSVGLHCRNLSLKSQVQAKLQLREYSGLESTFDELASPSRLFAPVGMFESNKSLETKRQSLRTAQVLVSVLSAVGTSRIEEAGARLSTLPASEQEDLLTRVQASLDAMRGLSQSLADERLGLTRAEQAHAANGTQLYLISKDFADTFGLSPEMESEEDENVEAYSSGVLEGLPRVKKLRDNIADLNYLKVELDGLRAAVKVEGTDPAAAFSKRLESLRNSYQSGLHARAEIESEIDARDEKIQRTAKDLQTMRSTAEANLRSEILQLLETGIRSPITEYLVFSFLG